jgi:hypothetical protein
LRLNDYRLNVTSKEEYRFPAVPVAFVGFNSTHDLSFRIPNMTAMFLDQSYTAWEESKHFLKEPFFTKYMNFYEDRGKNYILKPKSEHYFFDLIQKRMIAVVFAYTALESFANESIPNTFLFRRERADKKCVEEYTKEQIRIIGYFFENYSLKPRWFIKFPWG